MKQENTKQKILDTALLLFSERGYDSVSVDEIAKATGIKAPSLYNHYSSKQEIFNAIIESIAKQYHDDTNKINIHVENSEIDFLYIKDFNKDLLFEKVLQIFNYSLHNDNIKRFRKMMTIEQFRSSDLSTIYTNRFVNRLVDYHANIFRDLIKNNLISEYDPDTLALMYVSPIITLIGVCDRQMEKENECIKKLKEHVFLFYDIVHIKK